MIEIKARYEDGQYELRLEGHAEYNPGNDIVCAGASAIVYALLGALCNLGEHVETMASETESGMAWVLTEGDEQVEAVFMMALVGLLQIESAHPQHVHVERQGI